MKKLYAVLASLSLLFILIYSCSKDDVVNGGGGSSSSQVKTTISGMVLDENNTPQNSVTVTAYSQTTTTNQYGVFVLKDVNVNKERCVIEFTKAGFFNRTHAFIPFAYTVNYVRIVLNSNAQTHTLPASTGGTVSLSDGSSVQFQPNSCVTTNGTAYSGTVNLTVKHLSPDDANFGFMIPGGDLAGKDLNNEDVSLYTYGMLGVELKSSSGEALQLAAGTTATLTMSIATSQLASAPATIPLWYFDETTSLWIEEGVATKVGNIYLGTVTHFSWWNCDYSGPRAFIKGKVVDCEGTPMPNIMVTLDANRNTSTNQNGEYQNWIPSGFSFNIQVLTTYNPGLVLSSQNEIIPELSADQLFIIPDLLIPCPSRVAGIVKTCTGAQTSGAVYLSNASGFANYQYTLNGLFNIPVIPNAQLDLFAYNSNSSFYQSLTSLSTPNILNVGSLLLCDSIITSSIPNSFTINGGPFVNQTFAVDTTLVSVSIYLWRPIYIEMSGTSSPNFSIGYQVTYCDTILGTCPWSQSSMDSISEIHIYITDSLTQVNYNLLSIPGQGLTTLLQFDPIGGYIRGNYSGACSIYINGGNPIPANITGNFKVPRTQ